MKGQPVASGEAYPSATPAPDSEVDWPGLTPGLGTGTEVELDWGDDPDLTAPRDLGTMAPAASGTRSGGGRLETVPFTVVDGRGDWPTFVGGGPTAF